MPAKRQSQQERLIERGREALGHEEALGRHPAPLRDHFTCCHAEISDERPLSSRGARGIHGLGITSPSVSGARARAGVIVRRRGKIGSWRRRGACVIEPCSPAHSGLWPRSARFRLCPYPLAARPTPRATSQRPSSRAEPIRSLSRDRERSRSCFPCASPIAFGEARTLCFSFQVIESAGRRGGNSNSQPPVLETGALPIELHS